ncbi:8925_t:CDS:10, partial [Acaulospora morrowiae]
LVENERKKRGRPPKKENSTIVKELQKTLQTLLKISKSEIQKPDETVYQRAIISLDRLHKEFKSVKDVIVKVIDILTHMISTVIGNGLLDNCHEEDNWEKIVLDVFLLIEQIIQDNDSDREIFGQLCLKPFTQVLMKSTLSIDVRRTIADVVNALLTGCKENKKLLSQDNKDCSELVTSIISASDYELQLRYLEILFRLCPRMQKEREAFADKAFYAKRDVIPMFFQITASEFFGDTRRFLNFLNENNDGIIKTPKTFRVSRVLYNMIILQIPEGQDCFFVDFNKYTMSTTIKSAEKDETVENEVIDIKYFKISSWDIQVNSRENVIRISISESLRLGDESPSGVNVLSLIFDSHETHAMESIKKIFANRRV